MKILNAQGEAYDLAANTKLEFTRSNPFFSELGEQTIPVSLPASPRNLHLLNNPHRTGNVDKQPTRHTATIRSGAFSLNARQVVLSAQTHGNIQTSFYVNTGALYEQAKNLSLMEVFADKVVQFASVDAAITYARNVMITPDDKFAVFKVVTDNYIINRYGTVKTDGYASLHKEKETTETIDDNQILVPKGFYISPFIKVKHLLTEVLDYMGYTLQPSFLDLEPFASMVFLNDTLDTIIDGKIRYIDVVPNIMVSTLFEVLRKFNVEIVSDENRKTVSLINFDDMFSTASTVSLTDKVNGWPTVSYHNEYKQLQLSSEELQLPEIIKPFSYYNWRTDSQVSMILNTDRPDASFIEILSRYPGAYLWKSTGELLHQAFRGESEFTESVGSLAMSYYAGGVLATEQKTFPDTIPRMIFDPTELDQIPYVGAGRFLHSNIVFSDSSQSGGVSDDELRPMLCFHYVHDLTWVGTKRRVGTTSNYDVSHAKLWDYSLQWNGEDGIFEKFWRNYDKLLRNALLEVDYNLVLSEADKFMIGATDKVIIQNQEYFIKELKYSPEDRNAQTCKFLSLNMQAPISEAKPASEYINPQVYKWKLNTSRNFTIQRPQQSRDEVRYKSTPVTLLPAPPTQAQYNAGGQYHRTEHQVEYGYVDLRNNEYTKLGDGVITTYLTAILA